ncbi:MAG: hypothetical protein H6727_18110 [Myxococcales bacterium]|nr:hypothetical protein [Myxococcales bacterium]
MDTFIAELREILAQPPDWKTWDELIRFFDKKIPKEALKQAQDYAEPHLATWPDELRRLQTHHTQHRIWPLIRRLEFPLKKINKLFHDPRARFDHIKELRVHLETKSFSLDHIQKFSSLRSLELRPTSSTLQIEGTLNSTQLTEFICEARISDFEILQEFPNLEQLRLSLGDRKTLSRLPLFEDLQGLTLYNCSHLEDLQGIERYQKLELLLLNGCRSLQHIRDIQQLPLLRSAVISDVAALQSIRLTQPLEHLETLMLFNCSPALTRAEKLIAPRLQRFALSCSIGSKLPKGFTNLLADVTELTLYSITPKLIAQLPTLPQLRELSLGFTSDAKNIDFLKRTPNLLSLALDHLEDLKNIKGLQHTPKLEHLRIENSPVLRDAKPLASLEQLKSLSIKDCDELRPKPPNYRQIRYFGAEAYLQRKEIETYQQTLSNLLPHPPK